MTYLEVIIYLFSILIGIFTIFPVYRMYQVYRFKYLSTYLYFLISYAILGLLIQVGLRFVPILFYGQSARSYQVAIVLLCLLAYPFYPTAVYFFISFTRGLMGNTVSSRFRIGFFSFWVLFLFIFLSVIRNFLDTGDETLFYTVVLFANIIGNVLLYWAVILLLIKTKDLKERIKQKRMRIFGFLYLGCFALEYIYLLSNQYIVFLDIGFPVLYFFQNLPPVVYLSIIMKKTYRETLFESGKESNLSQLFLNHHITNREQEIIQLILKGKSNKDIEDELFISMQTVKNSISIIYRKMGVKNRIQLSNLIRNAQRED